MTQEQTQRHEITNRTVVYKIPGVEMVTVDTDLEYLSDGLGSLTMDIYYPPGWTMEEQKPAVVFVTGYPDAGFQAKLGCKQKEMGSYISWAKLVAASGLVAITYTNREPMADARALIQYVRRNEKSLGIDANRIGIWASSGNVPNALSILMEEPNDYLKCAVLCYGFMLDLQGSPAATEAMGKWGFASPNAGKSVEDFPTELPLFIARAGRDEFPYLNDMIDGFVAGALKCNLPITLVNHPTGPHAFDLLQDSETSRNIIRQILEFMRFHLANEAWLLERLRG